MRHSILSRAEVKDLKPGFPGLNQKVVGSNPSLTQVNVSIIRQVSAKSEIRSKNGGNCYNPKKEISIHQD